MAFRQYRRASSGVEAGVHALLYWLTIVTAPVWVPVLLAVFAYEAITAPGREAARIAEREVARHRVTVGELVLSDMRLETQGGRLEGRLRNTSSRFTVSEVGLSVILKDCNTVDCETVGQENVHISASTPAGQARDFSTFAYFPGNPRARRGKLEWQYQVVYVEAYPPASH